METPAWLTQRNAYRSASALDHLLIGPVPQGPQFRGNLHVSKRRMLPRYADNLRLHQALTASDGL